MPVTKIKLKGGKYRVRTPHGIRAKSTTKAKADAQERLLNAVKHGWKPTKVSRMISAGPRKKRRKK